MPLVKMEQKQVRFLFAGSFFSEEQTRNVRTFDHVPKPIPDGAFAYQFSVRHWVEDTETGEVFVGRDDKVPGTTFVGGEVVPASALDPDDPHKDILRSNCKANGWTTLIRCRTGNWQPFTIHDRRIEEQDATR